MGRERTLAKLGFGMIILLVGQYLLGMYTNLFVTIPDGVNGWQWMSNSLAIMGHVTLGTLLLVVSVALLVFGARARSRTWIVASLVGLVGIGAALAGGSSFMNGQYDAMSFLMAGGLGVAILAYAAALYVWALGVGGRQLAGS